MQHHPFSRFIVRSLFAAAFIISAAAFVFSQGPDKNPGASDAIRSSPAYSEILLKTDLQADLEAYSADYLDTNPKMIDLRFEIASLDKSLERVFAVKPAEVSKLTLALGKLIVRKAALDAELNRLMRSYNKDHPEVKRAVRRVEIFDAAIREVLH